MIIGTEWRNATEAIFGRLEGQGPRVLQVPERKRPRAARVRRVFRRRRRPRRGSSQTSELARSRQRRVRLRSRLGRRNCQEEIERGHEIVARPLERKPFDKTDSRNHRRSRSGFPICRSHHRTGGNRVRGSRKSERRQKERRNESCKNHERKISRRRQHRFQRRRSSLSDWPSAGLQQSLGIRIRHFQASLASSEGQRLA